jgi:hypothetical protein
VRDRLLVVLEVVLRPAEVIERLEPGGELRVGEPVDVSECLLAMFAGGADLPGGGLSAA